MSRRPRRSSAYSRSEMTSVMNYVLESLDDFVLLAQESPSRAITSAIIFLTLTFAAIWSGWIARLQRSIPLNLSSIQALRDRVHIAYSGRTFYSTGPNRIFSGFDFAGNTTYQTPDIMQSSTVMKRPNDPVDQPDANRHANPRPPKRNRVGFSSAANTDPRRFEREPAQQTNKPTRPVGQSRPLNRPFSDTSTDSEGDNLSEVSRGDANTTTYNLPRPLRVNIGGRTLTLESGSVSFYSSTGADGRGKGRIVCSAI